MEAEFKNGDFHHGMEVTLRREWNELQRALRTYHRVASRQAVASVCPICFLNGHSPACNLVARMVDIVSSILPDDKESEKYITLLRNIFNEK